MPRYLVERLIPGAGTLTMPELEAIAQQSQRVQRELASSIHWVHSMFMDDRMVCLYLADDEAVVREHARLSGLPIERISRVSAVLTPTLRERD